MNPQSTKIAEKVKRTLDRLQKAESEKAALLKENAALKAAAASAEAQHQAIVSATGTQAKIAIAALEQKVIECAALQAELAKRPAEAPKPNPDPELLHHKRNAEAFLNECEALRKTNQELKTAHAECDATIADLREKLRTATANYTALIDDPNGVWSLLDTIDKDPTTVHVGDEGGK